jgi:Na+/H+ antiporter NhaD/arsenite permease-like protein
MAVLALASGRVTPAAAWRAIDLDLLLILFALLVSVEILRLSGYLDLVVALSMRRFASTRSFAFALVLFSGLLATLVTNDVALFVAIPFTIVASRFSDFDVESIVILEVIATNLLGCLTPLGNPQNLFVYHVSGWTASHFVMTMLPFVGLSALALAFAIILTGPSHQMAPAETTLPARNGRAAIGGLITFLLVLTEIARLSSGVPAAIAAVIASMLFLRQRFFRIDLSIVPLFFCAFVVVEALRSSQPAQLTAHLYFASIGLSQVISNVPATVLLSPLAHGEWRTLLYGVNAGGCGTIIASLANLLGWRIYVRESGRDPRFFWRLTAVNIVFLAWVTGGGWLLLSVSSVSS